ncbi:site-specific integrase (plasmid) [Plesiomonas shigelloides]|uniref:site-specific integrase n=1 Tax=Plesiomonas TaxID=702 RepID=UPI000689EB4A|nr:MULTISPECIES: site-specific integrase [Plesiomonas]AVQ89146.1 site-specific integrase [Plesiomonas shigelloides]
MTKNRLRKIHLASALDRYYETVSRFKKGALQEFYRISTLKKSWLSDMYLSDISSVDVAKYRDERLSSINPRTNKHISPNTVRLELALLSSVFNIAKNEWGACRENPITVLRKPKPAGGRTRRLKKSEEIRLSRYFKSKDNIEAYYIFLFAIETAMRQGEILALEWSNVSLSSKYATLHETKNGESRTVPLSDKAISILLAVKEQSWSSERVFNYTANGLKSAWRTATIALKIDDLHFHDLRHEAISRFVELGTLNLIEVAAISGHKSMSMLKRYSHINTQQLIKKINRRTRRVKKQLFPSYPAMLTHESEQITLDFFDLDFKVTLNASDDWMSEAEKHLMLAISLRHIKGLALNQPSSVDLTEKCFVVVTPGSDETLAGFYGMK